MANTSPGSSLSLKLIIQFVSKKRLAHILHTGFCSAPPINSVIVVWEFEKYFQTRKRFSDHFVSKIAGLRSKLMSREI